MIRKGWSIVERIGRFLGREHYVGGKEFHHKYAFTGAVMFALAVLVLLGFSLAGEEGRPQDILMCLDLTGKTAGILCIGAAVSGFCWKGKWQWALLLNIAVLGSALLLTWWLLAICGWLAGYAVDDSIWDSKFQVACTASWTVGNIWSAIALWRSRPG